MSLIGHVKQTSVVTTKTQVTFTSGEIECYIRNGLVEQGLIDKDQMTDFEWDAHNGFVRDLTASWTVTS